MSVRTLACGIFVSVGILSSQLLAAVQVQSLTASVPSPQPLGTTVVFTAAATDSNAGPLTYRFRIGVAGVFAAVRDFSLTNSFQFTNSSREGTYQIEVTARDKATGETATMTAPFQYNSILVNGQAVVVPTAHPLVELFSAPPCPAGASISALFVQAVASPTPVWTRTNWKPCQSNASNNFYLAGLQINQFYYANYQVYANGKFTNGAKTLAFRTGTPSVTFPTFTELVPPTAQADPSIQVVLHTLLSPALPVATDRAGNVVWYYPEAAATSGEAALIMRVIPKGTMLLDMNGTGATNVTTMGQILREIDLAGNTLRETNASRLAEQTVAMGADAVTSVHHDAIRLPNGNTALIASAERIFPAGTQGSTDPVDIIGDMVLVLDSNFQLIWLWNSFDHLDISRTALLNEHCTGIGQPGCPPVLLAPTANDWMHSNSLYYNPGDGSFLLSMRHQDWVIKIDYGNGTGTGNILWRLGLGGDFTMNSNDPYPWFSHQHDAGFEFPGILSIYDNGNLRHNANGGNSRGQVLSIDETNKTVSLLVNADVGVYSQALGSAQLLPNGNYMYQSGTFPFGGNPTFSQTLEIQTDGTPVYNTQAPSSYRSWMLPSFYAPPGT